MQLEPPEEREAERPPPRADGPHPERRLGDAVERVGVAQVEERGPAAQVPDQGARTRSQLALTWGVEPTVAPRAGNHQQWRTIGALNARTGQVNYLDGYIVGRQQVIQFYSHLDRAYPEVDLIYVIQDNWNIHTHPDVLTALDDYPRIKPVWLPTYAPWLTPIEKLWRWLRQDVLKMHRWVEDWPRVKQRVHDFLAQFAHGSSALLRSVGLIGKGQLATVINTS